MVISLFGKTAICGKAVIGRKEQKSRPGLKGISSLNAQRTDAKKVKIGWCKVYSRYMEKFGKEIFTTREEAEKRLKELQNK